MLTGGVSLLASNNRGVVYVTVTGERTNVRTFTTRNPSATTLSSIRSLKAAADSVIAQASPSTATQGEVDHVAQLKQLAELHQAGALTDTESSLPQRHAYSADSGGWNLSARWRQCGLTRRC